MRGSLAAFAYLWSYGPVGWLALVAATFFLLSKSADAHASLSALCGSLAPGTAVALLVQYAALYSPLWLAGGWLLMVAAMMPPLLSVPVAHIWQSTFEKDRPGAIISFALGYASVWMVAAPPLISVALLWKLAAPGPAGVASLLSLAFVWSASPVAQTARNRCHRLIPVDPFGAGFVRDSFRQGLESGRWCALSCWPWMILPLAAGEHHRAMMAAVMLWLFLERLGPPRAARWQWPPALAVAARIA